MWEWIISAELNISRPSTLSQTIHDASQSTARHWEPVAKLLFFPFFFFFKAYISITDAFWRAWKCSTVNSHTWKVLEELHSKDGSRVAFSEKHNTALKPELMNASKCLTWCSLFNAESIVAKIKQEKNTHTKKKEKHDQQRQSTAEKRTIQEMWRQRTKRSRDVRHY